MKDKSAPIAVSTTTFSAMTELGRTTAHNLIKQGWLQKVKVTEAPDKAADDAWLPVSEALNRLCPVYGGSEASMSLIASRLHDGGLIARAVMVDSSVPKPIIVEVKCRIRPTTRPLDAAKKMPTPPPPPSSATPTPIYLGQDFWRRSVSWDEDVRSWDWGKGVFRITTKPKPLGVLLATNVHVPLASIQILEGKSIDKSLDKPQSSVIRIPDTRGPQLQRQRKYDWEPALIELLAIANKEGLEETFGVGKRGGKARLVTWFSDWFWKLDPNEVPSKSECEKRADRVELAIDLFKKSKKG